MIRFIYRSSLVEPFRWLVQLAGTLFRWARSRKWKLLVVSSIPSMLLVSAIGATWLGGRINEAVLAKHYFELGEQELADWEQSLGESSTFNAESQPEDLSSFIASEPEGERPAISSYGELLFRRLQLLEPSRDSHVIIASAMLQRGAIANGQHLLRKIAPDDKVGYAKAHALMAMSYIVEFRQTREQRLLPLFLHHAQIARNWAGTPRDVLLQAGELLWQAKKYDQALAFFESTAKRSPETYGLLAQRLSSVGQMELASVAMQKAVDYFQIKLKADPRNEKLRIQLAQMLSVDSAGIELAEQLLKQGQTTRPSPMLSRAMSDLYRVRFVLNGRDNPNKVEGFRFLDRAMVLDPTNPKVAENIAALMRLGVDIQDETDKRQVQELGAALNRVLVSGGATTGTHAMLAIYHLSQKRHKEAISHLEQIYQVAPTAIKFADHLAYTYAAEGRLDDALKVAKQCRQLIEDRKMLHEKFVDDLLDTQGRIHQKLGQLDEAIDCYELAININPTRQDTRSRLAKLYRHQGNDEKALTQDAAIQKIQQTNAQLESLDLTEAGRVSNETTVIK
jgi:tetratricopeptide (TPR) repeat protein